MRRYPRPNPVSPGTLIALLGGAALVGVGAYYVLKPKAAATTPTPGTPAIPAANNAANNIAVNIPGLATPAPGSITTTAQWNALTPTQQANYVASIGSTLLQFENNAAVGPQGQYLGLPALAPLVGAITTGS